MSTRFEVGILVLCLMVCLAAAPAALAAKTTPTTGVPAVSPAWTIDLEGDVLWQRVTPLGNLVVSTAAGLYGIEPTKGGIAWHHRNMGQLPAESYQDIPGTPYVLVEGNDSRAWIIESTTGAIVFDSQAVGISGVLSSHVLPQSKSLLIFGLRTGQATTLMTLLDIPTGKTRWTNEDILEGDAGKVVKFLTALAQAATGESGIVSDPYEIGDDAFLIATSQKVYRVNAATGKFDWKVDNLPGTQRTRFYSAPDQSDVVYAGSEVVYEGTNGPSDPKSHYSAYRVADGSAVWPKPVKIKGRAVDVIFLDEGLVISSGVANDGKIKFVEYASGNSRWGKKGKGLPIPGTVLDHAQLDEGVLLMMGGDSPWTRKGTEYFLNVIDPAAGAFLYSSPLKVKGRLLSIESLSKGVMYVTTSEVNFLELISGKRLLPKSVVSDGNLVTTTVGNTVYAYSENDGTLYAIDKQQAAVTKLSNGKIALGDKDEPDTLEAADGRITLASSQNIVAFERDGSVDFHAHHPAPRQPTLLRALYAAQAFRAGMAAASAGIYSGAFARAAEEQDAGSLGQTVASGLSQGYGEMAEGYAGLSQEYYAAFKARFKASAQSPEFVFMMVRSPDKGVDLAQVSKATGEIVARIHLGKDKDPNYQVDAISNRIYYSPTSRTIVGYAF